MKEYTFEEVISNIKQCETYKCTSDIYIVKTIYRDEIGLKFNDYQPLDCCGTNDIQRFIKVETPVSFNDVLNSDKKCRIEHDLIDNDEYSKNYHELDNLMNVMSKWYTSEELKTVIKEGRWFLEQN